MLNFFDVLLLGVSSPVLVGVYSCSDKRLLKSYKSSVLVSQALPIIFKRVLSEYPIKHLYYARGPGRLTSIKISYLFLKTVSIAKDIEFFGADSFFFNNSKPIKAFKDFYFVKNEDKISIMKCSSETISSNFSLPRYLDKSIFTSANNPLYIFEV